MKVSTVASALALCAMASASPLEPRANTKTVTKWKTTTATETETNIFTKTKYRTVTEKETIIQNNTKTKTISKTIVQNVSQTVTSVSTKTVPVTKTSTVVQPTTVLKSTTVVQTTTVIKPTTVIQPTTVIKPTTVIQPTTVIKPTTILQSATITMPVTVTVPVTKLSTVISNAPASTITTSGTKVTTVVSNAPAKTVTVPGKVTTVAGPVSTVFNTIINVVSQPASTITQISSVQGPTITNVQTVYAGNYTGNWSAITLAKTVTEYASGCSLPVGAATSASPTTDTPSSETSLAAGSYANVKTAQCDNPKAYYIQVDNSGTAIDGTVMLNNNPSVSGEWVYFSPPSSSDDLNPMAPQPFTFDNSTGILTSYWNTAESLRVFVAKNHPFSGQIASLEAWGYEPVTCDLEGNTLTNCGSTYGTFFEVGEQRDDLFDLWGLNSSDEQMFSGTFTLVPACDV